MANNRIWIKCKECNDKLFLGKTFGEGYFYRNYSAVSLSDKLNSFFDKHDICGENCFGIEYDEIEASAQPEPQWIPCSERLPEYGIQVLTTDKDGDFELNHIIDEDDGEWFWNGVIAWMPLPEPYQEGNT